MGQIPIARVSLVLYLIGSTESEQSRVCHGEDERRWNHAVNQGGVSFQGRRLRATRSAGVPLRHVNAARSPAQPRDCHYTNHEKAAETRVVRLVCRLGF